VQERVPCADRHGLYYSTSLYVGIVLGIDKIEDVYQRSALCAFDSVIFGLSIFCVVVGIIVQGGLGGIRVIGPGFSSHLLLLCPPLIASVSPLSQLVLCGLVLVQEEDGPILATQMGLVGQHEFSQHVLVTANWSRVLMFHDGARVNVERGNQNVLDMALGRVLRVLRTRLSLAAGHAGRASGV